MNIRKLLPAAALALAAAAGAGTAHAGHPDVQWSVRIGVPIPVPVLPILVPRYEAVPAQPAWRDRDRDGVPDWRDGRDNRWDHRRGGPAWRVDRDRDGIPDRYDRYDNRQDHRYDPRPGQRHDSPPAWRGHDRDRDGVPDWRDPRDNRRW